jgi:S1-C subfamily serine protease
MDDEALFGRAQRTFGTLAVGEAVAKVRAIVGLPNVPDSEKAAQAALDKLRSGAARPTAIELAALEFVIRMMRPAPLSRHGRLDPLPAKPGSNVYQPEVEAAWNRFRDKTAGIVYSVGRLERAAGLNPAVGTGFLVAPDLVLTNHHVLSALSHGADALDRGMAVIRFHQEFEGPPEPPPSPIVGVVKVHPTLDIALLRVELAAPRPALELDAGAQPGHLKVGTIGYPYKDPRNPLFVEAIYGGLYGMKRGAVGEVIESQGHIVAHDCSTLGGNSGSPLMALDTGKVVGLHFSGEFMYRNESVAAADVAEFLRGATGGA